LWQFLDLEQIKNQFGIQGGIFIIEKVESTNHQALDSTGSAITGVLVSEAVIPAI